MGTATRPFRHGIWSVLFIVRNGRSEVADFIDGLPIQSQKKVVRLVERVTNARNGPFDLHNEQKFRRLDENLYELKADQVRLPCFIEGQRVVILTHGFLKRTQKTPPAEIRRARNIRDRYMQEKN